MFVATASPTFVGVRRTVTGPSVAARDRAMHRWAREMPGPTTTSSTSSWPHAPSTALVIQRTVEARLRRTGRTTLTRPSTRSVVVPRNASRWRPRTTAFQEWGSLTLIRVSSDPSSV